MVDPDHAENTARIRELSPTGQFPALVDGDRTVTPSNAIIEYLDRIGSAPTMIPSDPDASLNARMLVDVFDSYIAGLMQQIVGEALRPLNRQDSVRVAEAKANLDKSYLWLTKHISHSWAIGDRFSIADCAAAPALFYADRLHPIPDGPLKSYRLRLLARTSVARVVNEARPYRSFFPLGAPDRD